VIPAYNEEGYIADTIKRVHRFLEKNFKTYEIIVVDDGSVDKTRDIVSKLCHKLKNLKLLKNAENRGKGESVKKGVMQAASEYILFSDADLSTPIEEAGKFLDYAKNGAKIIIGSRAVKGANILKKQGFFRQNMGKAFNLLVRIFLFKGIKDTQCGFKCFAREAARDIFKLQKARGFCFDAEILYIAKKKGYGIKEVPVTWTNRQDSRVTLIRGSFSMLMDIFRIRVNGVKGIYGKA